MYPFFYNASLVELVSVRQRDSSLLTLISSAQVSISRWHASVSFTEDGRFVVEDHNSKFGTLVAIRKPRLLALNPEALKTGGFWMDENLFSSEGKNPQKLVVQAQFSPCCSHTELHSAYLLGRKISVHFHHVEQRRVHSSFKQ